MSKRLIINIVACVAAVAIVVTSSFFVVRYFNAKENVVLLGGESKIEESTTETVSETTTAASQETTAAQSGGSASAGGSSGSSYTPVQHSQTPVVVKPSGEIQVSDKDKQEVQSYNKDTPATEEKAKKQAGTLGFLWNKNEGVFYSASDPWQRKFGYNKIYDWGAQLVILYYDTIRIKFNYGGLDWLIQMWKGQYGYVLLGTEVGVYYKDEGSPIEHYKCDDDSKRLKVGYTTYDNGEELFHRDYQDTWWLTGFVPGKLARFADRSELSMQIRITLKDAAMTKAFIGGLENIGFKKGSATVNNPDTYYSNGNDVYMYWQYISEMD